MFNRRYLPSRDGDSEHRRREDSAPRLRDEVVQITSLRLRFEDICSPGEVPLMAYAKPIVIPTAAAHFDIPCMEADCDGHHKLTSPILESLRKFLTSFEGESACTGMCGDTECTRILGYEGEATYLEVASVWAE